MYFLGIGFSGSRQRETLSSHTSWIVQDVGSRCATVYMNDSTRVVSVRRGDGEGGPWRQKEQALSLAFVPSYNIVLTFGGPLNACEMK